MAVIDLFFGFFGKGGPSTRLEGRTRFWGVCTEKHFDLLDLGLSKTESVTRLF